MYEISDENDLVECPYNGAHRMMRKRLVPHLIKCRKNYPNSDLQKCPFNQIHLIPEADYVEHVTNCPDRKLLTHYKYDAPVAKEEEVVKHAPIECDENWDDTEVIDYNPQKYLATANVLRRPENGRKRKFKKEIIKVESLAGSEDEKCVKDKYGPIKTEYDYSAIKKESDILDISDIGTRRPKTPPAPNIKEELNKVIYKSPSRSRSRSRSREYEFEYYRERPSQPYREYNYTRQPAYSEYGRLSPGLRRMSPFNRRPVSPVVRSRKSPEYDYDPDDDPYYNGGGGSGSSSRDDEPSSSRRYGDDEPSTRRRRTDYQDPYDAFNGYYPPPSFHNSRSYPNIIRHLYDYGY